MGMRTLTYAVCVRGTGRPLAPDVLRALVRARLRRSSVSKTTTFLDEVPVADRKSDKKTPAV